MSKPKPIRILPVEYLRECFTYDPETGVLRWKVRPREHFADVRAWHTWNSRYAGKPAGCTDWRGYRVVVVKYRINHMHRVIWKWMTGEEPPAVLDHKDGDPLNNRWDNLRPATDLESVWNTGARKNVSGYRGVRRAKKRWIARISENGIRRWIGSFTTPEEASVAYESAARELHGEFYRQPIGGK